MQSKDHKQKAKSELKERVGSELVGSELLGSEIVGSELVDVIYGPQA